jgi:hypothetical protein
MSISFARLLILAFIAYAAYTIELQEEHDLDRTFCWKDS